MPCSGKARTEESSAKEDQYLCTKEWGFQAQLGFNPALLQLTRRFYGLLKHSLFNAYKATTVTLALLAPSVLILIAFLISKDFTEKCSVVNLKVNKQRLFCASCPFGKLCFHVLHLSQRAHSRAHCFLHHRVVHEQTVILFLLLKGEA